jgi:hypothetical protein
MIDFPILVIIITAILTVLVVLDELFNYKDTEE